MNGVVVMLVCAAVLACGYLGYGRWLANKWGVDREALTPAKRMKDGKNFSPVSAFTAFSHQFSSICGAGPVTGTIVAMAFGWLPVVLWVLVGGIFFGAVHDFGALYASMKNNGKSLAQLIEKYIGKTGRRLFLLFCWLFCIIVIAAFTDMVCGTFKFTPVMGADGVATAAIDFTKSYAAGCAGTISILFTFVAIAFGYAQKKFNLTGVAEFATGVVLMVLMFAVGMQFPLYLDKFQWFAVVMVYLVFAGAMPISVLKTPRDYLTSIMMIVMIVCAVLGIFVLGAQGQATITAPVFTGFSTASGMMIPILFVSVACGALSGFHSLVSSGTSSKQVEKEADAVKVGYGAMIVESFVGVLAALHGKAVPDAVDGTGVKQAVLGIPVDRLELKLPAATLGNLGGKLDIETGEPAVIAHKAIGRIGLVKANRQGLDVCGIIAAGRSGASSGTRRLGRRATAANQSKGGNKRKRACNKSHKALLVHG